MDKLEFYINTTTYLALMIEKNQALHDLFRYLLKFMPMRALVWNGYNPTTDTVEFQLIVTSLGVLRLRGLETRLSKNAAKTVNQVKEKDFLYIDHASQNPMTSVLLKKLKHYLDQKEKSVLLMDLEWAGKPFGHLSILKNNDETWLPEHIELLLMLKRPFSFAARHMERYIELLKIQGRVIEEKEFLIQELRRATGSVMIGADGGLKDIMKLVRQVTHVDTPVLIFGETGVGKEIVADAIHMTSRRQKGPYVKVNCGAIPDTLIDAELFGYEKGAFTGANTSKKGKFERANGGTIFLDEIGELPLRDQVRLLRVLQNRELERVGGTKTIPIDVRFITATHRDLHKMVRDGSFREDLFYRLNVFPIVVPPLRHRKSDIPALVKHLIAKKVKEMKITPPPEPEENELQALFEHDWPGNVRELENLLERSLIINPKGPLQFSPLLYHSHAGNNRKSRPRENRLLPLDEINRQHIIKALEKSRGKVNGRDGAARILQIKPNTLRRRMDKLNIDYGRNYNRKMGFSHGRHS